MEQENKEKENLAKKIRAVLNRAGYEIPTLEEFLKGIEELYHKPSLAQIVDEELPKIIQHEPNFFNKYGIELPEKLDVAIFDLYYNEFGAEGARRVTYSAGVWFRHLRFFLVTNHEEELKHAVNEFKRILRGDYFDRQ